MTGSERDFIRALTRQEREALRQELVEKQQCYVNEGLRASSEGRSREWRVTDEAIADAEMLRFLIQLLDHPDEPTM